MAAAGVTVVSGMALGIDAAAHRGALDAGGPTIAVLAAGPERAYPRRARTLHGRILESGTVVSELPLDGGPRRWMFPARNRLIAALAALTVVVEARSNSGALLTAGRAAELGRTVGAVPGRITSPLAGGPHRLLRDGALLVSGAEDLLDGVFGLETVPRPRRLPPDLQGLLDALAEGHAIPEAVARAGLGTEQGLAALAVLELAGRIRRGPAGGYAVLP
jgi:DNA processing protein